MDLENKRREKEGKYNKRKVLQDFIDLLDGKTEETVIKEFVIVAKGTHEGEDSTDVFCTTGDIHEVIGILEVGKLYMFDNR